MTRPITDTMRHIGGGVSANRPRWLSPANHPESL